MEFDHECRNNAVEGDLDRRFHWVEIKRKVSSLDIVVGQIRPAHRRDRYHHEHRGCSDSGRVSWANRCDHRWIPVAPSSDQMSRPHWSFTLERDEMECGHVS